MISTIQQYCLSKASYTIITLLCSLQFCYAQYTLKAKLDTNQYQIGDYVKVNIAATFDSSYIIELPLLPETIFIDSTKSVDFNGAIKIDSVRNGKIIKNNFQYNFLAFDSGKYFIPPISFTFTDVKNKKQKILNTDTLYFNVLWIEADTSKAIKPIKAPLNTPFILAEIKEYLIYGALAWLIIALLVYVYFAFFKRKKKKEIAVVPEIVKPSHEIALEKLEHLKKQQLWQRGEVKKYHSDLSDIIREYLENRFQIIALEATTDEIAEKMRIFSIPPEQKENLHLMLQLADLVKFAKVQPLPDEHEASFERALQFIHQTKYEATL